MKTERHLLSNVTLLFSERAEEKQLSDSTEQDAERKQECRTEQKHEERQNQRERELEIKTTEIFLI